MLILTLHEEFLNSNQQFEILTNHLNKEINFVVLMCLRSAQTHENYKEFFSYFEPLNSNDSAIRNMDEPFE